MSASRRAFLAAMGAAAAWLAIVNGSRATKLLTSGAAPTAPEQPVEPKLPIWIGHF
jgi:hypothetical protein